MVVGHQSHCQAVSEVLSSLCDTTPHRTVMVITGRRNADDRRARGAPTARPPGTRRIHGYALML